VGNSHKHQHAEIATSSFVLPTTSLPLRRIRRNIRFVPLAQISGSQTGQVTVGDILRTRN